MFDDCDLDRNVVKKKRAVNKKQKAYKYMNNG